MTARPLRILVTGSRAWTDWHTVEVALRRAYLQHRYPISQVTVVHGGAAGADACADILARRMGFQVEVYPADWASHGRAAGPRRNAEMVALGADVCLAFPIGASHVGASRGTWNCIRLAEQAGIPVVVHEGTTP